MTQIENLNNVLKISKSFIQLTENYMFLRKTLASILCASTILLSGCIHTVDAINLKHQPAQTITKLPQASNQKVSINVFDARADKSKVGTKIDGMGNPAAAIIATEDVAFVMKKSIESELVQRGFAISDTAPVAMNVNLNAFMSSFDLGFLKLDSKAEIKMSVNIANSGKNYQLDIQAVGGEKFIQVVDGDNARIALEMAIDNALNQLFADSKVIETLTAR
ncbi:hypothetical protein HQ393_02250 [Chitinibacter bivalviorum]|uniref:Lipoprotein n=1 Tax=Chitinibacter bivalviorum TaxID=2739434 RepID=A0A7H9BFG5_9NEIS|nr:YajG family lipoprotein [Chitinibacter bivalviorum]QLG87162.1 hypothetical protein HQ393_02250 [Chitinibacter bivalviorum]